MDLPSFDQSTWLALVAVLVATSLLAGLVAGLLGVGGGIVTVPILEYALHFTAMPPEATLHVAVATSLATIVPTAIASSRAHHARGSIDWALVHAWAVPMLLGSLIGSLLAAHAPVRTLAAIFGTIALVVALKMLLPTEHWRLAPQAPRGVAGSLVATTIGGISATMGIGGGTLAVPTLTVCGMPVHRAVGTAAFFGLLISIPGTLGYLLAQPPTALPSGTVGFVSLLGFAILAPGATLMAPLGARIAHGLSRRALSAAFGIFLLSVAARMLYRSMA